ncbi:MAG: 2-isopropylmalate synthase [Planctomycetota bacterium]
MTTSDPNVSAHAQDRLILFDTTLRDGEQAPGFSMQLDEKLVVARALAALGVDWLEAGFPAASDGDFEAVRAIASQIEGPGIAALARCVTGDVERAADAVAPAARGRVHVFLATSPLHREKKLRMDRDEVLRRVEAGVRLARSRCADVEFSAEDASRTEPEFLVKVVQVAIDAGATTINLPDTVGYSMPAEYGAMFANVREHVRGIDGVVLSTHCHDDLGLAVANSLAGVQHGARQVECTINGIGERAGNCALEEVAMAVRTRPDRFGVASAIDTTRLCATSRVLAAVTGVGVPPNKAIVGDNAFAHESGIHQHGVLQHRATYEVMRAEDVGARACGIVLGKHSGRHALVARTRALGFALDDDELDRLFVRFKELADRKKQVFDGDLEALIHDEATVEGPWHLRSLHASAGAGTLPSAAVRMRHREHGDRDEAAVGDGPVDAAWKAIVRATGIPNAALHRFQIHSATLGEDAQGRVTAECRFGDDLVRGHGVHTDIVEASARAFLDAINRNERSAAAATAAAATTEPN